MEEKRTIYCFQLHHGRDIETDDLKIYVSKTVVTEYFSDMLNMSICRYRDEKSGNWQLFDLKRLDRMQQNRVYTYEDDMDRAMKIMIDEMRRERERLLASAERESVYIEALANLVEKSSQTS